MSSGMYVGMNGANARLFELDAISDNLANANTPGYRATRPVFEAVMAEAGSDKVLTNVAGAGVDLRSGAVMNTERPLDIRPGDDMYLSVRTATGDVAYTRDGRIQVEPTGRLVIGGRPVLNESGGEIFVPVDAHVSLDNRGRVLLDHQPVDNLGFYRLEGRVDRIGPALLQSTTEGGARPVDPELRQAKVGELDGSNYPALDATLALVNAQRAYDHSMQALQTYKKLDELAMQLGRPRS